LRWGPSAFSLRLISTSEQPRAPPPPLSFASPSTRVFSSYLLAASLMAHMTSWCFGRLIHSINTHTHTHTQHSHTPAHSLLPALRPTRYEEHLNHVLEGNSIVTLRTRLECEIVQDARAFAGGGLENRAFFPDHSNHPSAPGPVERAASAPVTPRTPQRIFQTNCLNEVVIDRGPSSYLSAVDIFCDGRHITCVQVVTSPPSA
jgi:hypothetical protein